jgi:AAA+ superfamily predicted ATPase
MEPKTALEILYNELDWLQNVINQVITSYLVQEGHENSWLDIEPPDLNGQNAPYATTVNDWELDTFGRLALILAIAPHLRPEALDIFFGKNQIYDRGFSEFGGLTNKSHSGFLPTGQTYCFLVTATNPELRPEVMQVINNDSVLMREQVLVLGETEAQVPRLSGILGIAPGWLQFFTGGEKPGAEHSDDFPARRITSPLNWEDVVLDELVLEQVNELTTWLQHGQTLMKEWGLEKKIKPGYRALFYGPPGTGKTLVATLLGKTSGRDVYCVDLSMMVSKYIGETEKNLSKLFETARHRQWILFFDEADALFGKRTAANSSNDRHANQQTAHLLQLIEDFPGVVILASNLRSNMDEAFTRRFQSIIQFNMPSAEERLQLWENAFAGTCALSPEIDLTAISRDYELSGGAIINVLRYCAMSAIKHNSREVSKHELLAGLKREFKKENKTLLVNR